TDYLQSETLSDRVHAKKIFELDSVGITSAELFIFGSATSLEVNGAKIAGLERLTSTGWTRAKIPVEHLKKGKNEFRLWGGGSLRVERSKQPGRSFKSADGGRTWHRDSLGAKGNQQGEYLIRLRIGRHAPRGWAMSPVLDLWGADIGRPAKLTKLSFSVGEQPKETSVKVLMRTGSSPDPDEKTWTPWTATEQERFHLRAVQWVKENAAGHRWAQLKFELQTQRPQQTPAVSSKASFEAELAVEKAPAPAAKLKSNPPRPAATPVPFIYEAPSPR